MLPHLLAMISYQRATERFAFAVHSMPRPDCGKAASVGGFDGEGQCRIQGTHAFVQPARNLSAKLDNQCGISGRRKPWKFILLAVHGLDAD
jgi:hypothetical protein